MSDLSSEKTFADMSSNITSQLNQVQAQLEAILGKLKTDPSSITAEEACLLSEKVTASDERAGSSHVQAPHRSLLTAAKDLLAAVDSSADDVTPEVIRIAQGIVSKMYKAIGHFHAPHPEYEAEIQEEIARMEPKIAKGTITKAEVDHLHSLEARAHGRIEKGGITAKAQAVLAKRERQISAQEQYHHDKEVNLRQAEAAIRPKIYDGTVTQLEADQLHALEFRAHGSTVKGGVAAIAQSTSARRGSNASDERSHASKSALSPQERSHHDKEENLRQAEAALRPKVEAGTVTAAEAHKLQSREMRAHGHIEKGGLSAKAQSIVTKRHQKTLNDASNHEKPLGADAGHQTEET